MNVEYFRGHKHRQPSPLLLLALNVNVVQLNSLSHNDEGILNESLALLFPLSTGRLFLVISRSAVIVKTVSKIEINTSSCKLNIFVFLIFKFQAVNFYFLQGMNLQGRRVNSITKRQRARSLKKKRKQSYALKVLHPTETISSSLRLSIIIAWCASCQVRE